MRRGEAKGAQRRKVLLDSVNRQSLEGRVRGVAGEQRSLVGLAATQIRKGLT